MRRVVVTGFGVVSPIGVGTAAFFEGLREGRSGVDIITRFDASAFPTRIAGEVRGVGAIDAGVSPEWTAALARDPKSVYGVVAAREAIRNAFGTRRAFFGHDPRNVGVYLAAGLEIFNLEDLMPHLLETRLDGAGILEAVRQAAPHAFLQVPADLAVRIIVGETGVKGPVAVNVSACAAGTQALGDAFHAIRDGAVDAALAGGYDSMVNPLGVGGFCMLEAMSKSNELRGAASRPFDRRRDGFVLGEGAAVFVLEESRAAERRGAPMLAEVLGYGSSLDAYRVSDPAPDHAGAIACMTKALSDAEVAREDVDYINAHGTATRKNDPAETAAIRAAFGTHAYRLAVSSTKSQIGHLIGAAGAVEFAACLFALEEGILPATINLEDPDPDCDLDYVPLHPRQATVSTVLSTSFGFGGQNAAIVLGKVRRDAT